MEIFKRLKDINISFYKDSVDSKISPLGDKCTVSSFHFEEAISFPYTGLVVVRSRYYLDFDSLDLNCLIVKIDYTVEDKAKAELKDTRLIWALVKNIQSLPDYQITDDDNKVVTYYQYQLALVSPLERLKNYHCNTFYKGLKIHEILRKLLVPNSTTSLPLISESNINVHNLETVEALNTSKVLIQPNDESYYDFFNKLLIAYGINYILQFDEKNGVKITFSRDQNYCYVEKTGSDASKTKNTPILGSQRDLAFECGKAPDKHTDSTRFAYLNTENYSKSYVALEETDEIVKSVRHSFLSLETAGNDFEFLKNKQIDEIETNIRTRLNFSRTFLESSGFRDIRVYPGCHLNIIQNAKRVPY